MLEAAAAVLKGLGYAATLIAAGPVLAAATLRDVPRAPKLVRWAGVVLAMTAGSAAWLFVLRLGGQADAASMEAIFLSPLGVALSLQFAGGLWLAALVRGKLALPGAIMVVAAFGIVGHAPSNGSLAAALVMLHVVCVTWWFGGLCVLLLASHRRGATELGELAARFSRQAIVVVALLVTAALTLSAILANFRFDPASDYQRGLLVKSALLLGLLALASVNKLSLTPRLAVQADARSWLRRAIALEMVLFAALIGTTSWLTTYQSPHDHRAGPNAAAPIAIVDAWAPAMLGGARTGAAYMVITNNQIADDTLRSVSSPWAEQVTLHTSISDGLIARMRNLPNLPIAAGASATLAPGSRHLMFSGLYAPFVAGDVIPLTLTFEKAGDVQAAIMVLPLGERPGDTHDHGEM